MNDASAVLERLRPLLGALREGPAPKHETITMETNVVTDLGLTSLKFVDLTLAIEETLGIDEFPIQAWLDEEQVRGSEGFRVRSIVDTCLRALNGAA